MMWVKVISSEINQALQRVVKYQRLGKSDIQTSIEASPFGVDSNPIKNWVAVYAETSEKGKTVIVGYLNKNQLAATGEYRNYSTNDDGEEVFYTWLKKNGTMEIGGTENFAVKFNELKTEFNKLKESHNTLAEKWNSFCTAYVPGSPSVTGTPATLSTSSVSPNDSDIDNSKNDKIKTI
jgi:hypothetical protein